MDSPSVPGQIRALSAIRLSVKTDETTSPGRQRAANGAEIARRGAVAIGEAEDLDVSATRTTPFERPELGAWLKRPDDYDMIVWWRMDRAVRSMADMAALGQWAKEHGKLLVFAEGPGGAPLELDMRTQSPVSELIMLLLAFAAQMEAAAIRERVTGAMATLRAQGRYSGGLVPFGYKKTPNPEGAGWKLAPDADSVVVLERIIRDVLEGKSLTAIGMELNQDEVPVPRDYQARLSGRATGGKRHGREIERFKWTAGTLSKILRSQALMGYRTHKGKPVRDTDGNAVLIGEPVLTRDEFDTLQEKLAERTNNTNRTRTNSKALLLQVAHCEGCQGRMYRAPRKGFPPGDYVCRATARGETCESPAGMRADWLDTYVEREFVSLVGPARMTRTIEHKGYDPGVELREIERELRALYADKESRKSRTGRRIWQEEVDVLERRATVLESTPRTEARVEVIETGETFAQHWQALEPRRPKADEDLEDPASVRTWETYRVAMARATQERRTLLLRTGARVYVSKGRSGGGVERLGGPDTGRLRFSVEHDIPGHNAVMDDDED